MHRHNLPCGVAPGSNETMRSGPPAPRVHRPLLLGPGGDRQPITAETFRPVVPRLPQRFARIPQAPVPTAPSRRGPLLLGPGRVKPEAPPMPAWARSMYADIAKTLRQPSESQRKRINDRIAENFGENNGRQLVVGFLPLRVDMHPNGNARLVVVNTEVPAGILPKDYTPKPVGYMLDAVFGPQPSGGWRGEPWTPHDPSPAWQTVEDVRWAPPKAAAASETYHETAEQAVDRSGYKAPAKVRDVRDAHWRTVAGLLHKRRPVAFDVLDDYPALTQFYAANLAAAQTAAEAMAVREANDNPDDPDITVHWSVEQGLLLYTRGKEDRIIAAIRAVRGRGMGFKWSSSLGAWYRPQSVGVSESTVDIDRVANALRQHGMVVAVERGQSRTLGQANARRQDHKFWRAEGYVARAEGAVERAEEADAKAASILADVPVGASTRRAERAEERAERQGEKAAEHLEYVEHAASAAQNLARTAAGYETTAQISRKEAEKRADAFARIFVARIKGATGAERLISDKTDNLSEYRLSWAVLWPNAANIAPASVAYDGRVIVVRVWPQESLEAFGQSYWTGRRYKTTTVLADETYDKTPERIFEEVVGVLPRFEKVKVDVSGDVPVDAAAMQSALAKYARPRVAAALRGAVPNSDLPIGIFNRVGLQGTTVAFSIAPTKGYGDHTFGVYPLLYLIPRGGMTFELARNRKPQYQRFAADPYDPESSLTLDLTGASIGTAWATLVAAAKALFANNPASFSPPPPPKPKRAAKPARAAVSSPARIGRVETLARDLDATPAARAADVRSRAAALAELASARLAEMRGESASDREGDALLQRARSAGNSLGFYPTPPSLASYVVDLSGAGAGTTALEPSAGMGSMVGELVGRGAEVTALELQPERAAYLQHAWSPAGARIGVGDFLAMSPGDPGVPEGGFDVVVMNPPFSVGSKHYTDVDHVLHAMRFVRPGGRLVAVMSSGSVEPSNKKRAELHAALSAWSHRWEPVEAKRFRISGTDVPSTILVAERPKQNRAARRGRW